MPDLITTRLKLKDVYPDLEGYDEDAEFIRKGITPSDLEIKEGERAIISYITTAAKDRDNEIVLPSGADLKDYRKNPVVLFGHQYSALPIGKNMWIKSDEKGLIAKTQYANHEEADKVYQYRKDGFPLAESIGFIPIKTFYKKWVDGGPKWEEGDLRILEQDYGLKAKDLKEVRAVYVKWNMLEYSDVAVPSNPEAMQLAKSKGLIKEEKVKVHEKDCECEACVNARKNLESGADDLHTAKDVANLMEKLGETIKTMSKTISELEEQVKELQEDKAHEEHEKEYYTFKLESEDVSEDVDYADIIKDSVKLALEENKKSALSSIKDITKEVFEQMSGKVVAS